MNLIIANLHHDFPKSLHADQFKFICCELRFDGFVTFPKIILTRDYLTILLVNMEEKGLETFINSGGKELEVKFEEGIEEN
jgi:hypothetical protein